MATVGENIKRRREKLKFSQNRLSKLCGVSQSGISAIEYGKISPSVSTLEMISKALNCTVSDLTGDTKKETAENGNLKNEAVILLSSLSEERQKQALDYLRFLSKSEDKK